MCNHDKWLFTSKTSRVFCQTKLKGTRVLVVAHPDILSGQTVALKPVFYPRKAMIVLWEQALVLSTCIVSRCSSCKKINNQFIRSKGCNNREHRVGWRKSHRHNSRSECGSVRDATDWFFSNWSGSPTKFNQSSTTGSCQALCFPLKNRKWFPKFSVKINVWQL